MKLIISTKIPLNQDNKVDRFSSAFKQQKFKLVSFLKGTIGVVLIKVNKIGNNYLSIETDFVNKKYIITETDNNNFIAGTMFINKENLEISAELIIMSSCNNILNANLSIFGNYIQQKPNFIKDSFSKILDFFIYQENWLILINIVGIIAAIYCLIFAEHVSALQRAFLSRNGD